MKWLAIPLLALAPVAIQACHAQPTPGSERSYDTGELTIGGEAFAPGEILDARAMPDINRQIGIMLSLSAAGAARLERISTSLVGKPLPITLDGRTLAAELVRKPLTDGIVELPGRWTLDEAESLARRISGRDPLPDDLEE